MLFFVAWRFMSSHVNSSFHAILWAHNKAFLFLLGIRWWELTGHTSHLSWVSMETRLHWKTFEGKTLGPQYVLWLSFKTNLNWICGSPDITHVLQTWLNPGEPCAWRGGGKLTASSFHVLSHKTACSPLCSWSTGLDNFAECQERLMRWDTGFTIINAGFSYMENK